jgi:hypothetical protein
MQDAFATWKPADEFKLDAGMMLVPFSHNSIQGAATLLGWDYYAFTFLQPQLAGVTNFAGRDTGVQLRGLIAKMVEYRLGLFQGNRAAPATGPTAPPPASRTAMRFMARVQLNLLDPETGYFYAGTYGGTKKVLSIGGGIDLQDDYKGYAGDAFLDLPIGDDVLTAQVDVLHFDGGTWIPALLKQTEVQAEAGYRIGALKLSPIVRFEDQIISNASSAAPNVQRYGVGLAWWVMNHNMNVKAFYSYVKPDNGSRKYSQINLQMQFYVF